MLPSFHVPASSSISAKKLKAQREAHLRKMSSEMDSLASSNVDAASSQETCSFEAPRHDGPVSAVPAGPAPVVEDTATTASDDDDIAEHAAESAQPESTTPPGSPPAAAAATAPKPNPPTAKPPVRYSLFPKILDYPKFNPPTRGPITAESWARWGPQAPQNQPPGQAQAQARAQAQAQTQVEEERSNSKEETGMRKVFTSALGKINKTFTKARVWIKISGSWSRRQGRRMCGKKD
ncbi:hypothetical protein V8F33_010514 [Rhypophila sp. PSN 637]